MGAVLANDKRYGTSKSKSLGRFVSTFIYLVIDKKTFLNFKINVAFIVMMRSDQRSTWSHIKGTDGLTFNLEIYNLLFFRTDHNSY